MPTVLAIETSCDETAAAVVRDRTILSNVVASQMELHATYGGVVPDLAARQHLEAINWVIAAAQEQSALAWQDLDGIAVTAAPGLIGALLIGVTAAKTLALIHRKPLIGIHHLEGHLCSAFLADRQLEPPFLCLLVSGGHSSLIVAHGYGHYELVGRTRDDAAGEAFDKVARLLGLGYPGGPAIDRLAQSGDRHAYRLPQGKIPDAPFDFSFSGLKTAVLRLKERLAATGEPLPTADIAASFQWTIAQALVNRAIACAQQYHMPHIVAVGGVAANSVLRHYLVERATQEQIQLTVAPLHLCTDNAAMIGCAGACTCPGGNAHTSP
ncbi:MAG: tRNA (adenosine(37)-N6)-threonylcarbamoyltransferase complex transferase subunit TsaD [Oscillatoriales cyanobacterium SM2_2_1]|nr:tRNA (adenosine(37)-N6)-threonylcarbamoyltransferase complex transferase subunit TsaD [Oscillatoriales cyanobacterium SM2_2_1]